MMHVQRKLIVSIFIFLLVIVGGAFAYNQVEGWSPLDSIYFVVITVTTIGYGDLVPITEAGKIFTMFFSFFGVAMAFYFLSLMSGAFFKKHITEHVTAIKKGVRREQEIKEEIKTTIKKAFKKKK